MGFRFTEGLGFGSGSGSGLCMMREVYTLSDWKLKDGSFMTLNCIPGGGCFFICQELYWMRLLCISFTSSCILFPVGRGNEKFEDWGRLQNFRLGGLPIFYFFWGGEYFCWGWGQYPIKCHVEHKNEKILLVCNKLFLNTLTD